MATGQFLEITFCISEVIKCHSLETHIGHIFFQTAHLQMSEGHTYYEESRWRKTQGAVQNQQKPLHSLQARQGPVKYQILLLPLPGAG